MRPVTLLEASVFFGNKKGKGGGGGGFRDGRAGVFIGKGLGAIGAKGQA